ncbi:hypothetical protein SLA2020_147810 [Shorea laevis]
MFGKKILSFKKLTKKAKSIIGDKSDDSQPSQQECLLKEIQGDTSQEKAASTPKGCFAIYVGEERERFVVPISFLSHPLFKMLLDKSYDEVGFKQGKRLVVPCSVSTFQEIVNALKCSNGKFDFGNLVEEFI